jgi:hypothetical protein
VSKLSELHPTWHTCAREPLAEFSRRTLELFFNLWRKIRNIEVTPTWDTCGRKLLAKFKQWTCNCVQNKNIGVTPLRELLAKFLKGTLNLWVINLVTKFWSEEAFGSVKVLSVLYIWVNSSLSTRDLSTRRHNCKKAFYLQYYTIAYSFPASIKLNKAIVLVIPSSISQETTQFSSNPPA